MIDAEERKEIEEQTRMYEASIIHTHKIIDAGEALNRLLDNPDFISVIFDNFLKEKVEEAIIQFGTAGHIPARYEYAKNILTAASILRDYFRCLQENADTAREELPVIQESLAELQKY